MKPCFNAIIAYEGLEFVHTGIHNQDSKSCNGGADCNGKLYDSHNSPVNTSMLDSIVIDAAGGACVAYSRTQDALVSIDCSAQAWTLCSKHCTNMGECTVAHSWQAMCAKK